MVKSADALDAELQERCHLGDRILKLWNSFEKVKRLNAVQIIKIVAFELEL